MNENKTVSPDMSDDWSDIDFSDISDTSDVDETEETSEEATVEETDTEETPVADHSEEATTEAKPDETGTAPEEKAEADHSFKLKYMGEEKEFSREETIALAQKGMDYDRIKAKLDEAAEVTEFVRNIAQEMNLSTADFMLQALAGNLAKKENISLDEAKRRIELDRREKALAAKEAAAEERAKETKAQDARREKAKAELAEFVKAYPTADVRNIPHEVYQNAAKMQIGLTAAYAMHEAQQAKAALEAEKQNAKNKERSVGSASTSGKRTPADEFDALWYNDD